MTELLEMELLNKLQELSRMRRLEADLFRQFDFAFNWVLRASEKGNLELPNKQGIYSCLKRIRDLADETLQDKGRQGLDSASIRIA